MSPYQKYTKIFAYVSLSALILSLIPLMVLGFFAHPLGDDFHYGYHAAKAIRESGNILMAIPEAIKGTFHEYNVWQGTYSAIFLMYLPPHLLGEFFYKLYPSILLLFFTVGIFYMLYPIVKHNEKISLHAWVGISSILVLLCITQVPACGETFYWYNGSVYYTGFLSVTFFFFGLLFRFLKDKKTYRIVLLCILSLFIAGGNYASLLPSVLTVSFILFISILKKREKKITISLIVILLLLLTGLAVSILAPGNSVRAATTSGTTPIKAVAKSVIQCIHFTLYWNGIASFVSLFLVTPIFINVISNSDKKIKLPIPLCILFFLIYSSCETASFYGQNNGGPARLFDISFYMTIIVVFIIYYLLLYAIAPLFEAKKEKKNHDNSSFLTIALCFIGLIFVLLLIVRPLKESTIIPNQIRASICLFNGEASDYNSQYLKRMDTVSANKGADVVFEPYEVPKRLEIFLHLGDLSDDPNDFNNEAFAEFYGLNSVKINSPD